MGYSDYFLIVWDFVKYARMKSLCRTRPGFRTRFPGKLLLGHYANHPLEYELLFERFLNPERITMPDMISIFRTITRYRHQICRRSTGKPRGANLHLRHISKSSLREAAKILKLPETRLNELLKIVGNSDESMESILASNSRLKSLTETYPDIAQVINLASKLEGLPRTVSTHAAGIVITKENLLNYTPLDKGMNGIYQTQYEASDLEALGLLKMDFLSLKNLSNIKKTLDLIQKDYPSFAIPNDFQDFKTFRMLSKGWTTGVFQLESAGMRKMLMELGVNRFSDLTLALALYRPGPLEMVPQVVARKKGKEPLTYLHPDLEPILKETYGTLVYQEQILLIARKFAGYTSGSSRCFATGGIKKNREILKKNGFRSSAASRRGYEKAVAEEIYDYIVRFADYGFNSALGGYAMVA